MTDNSTIILNGFFALPNLEKLAVVNAINEYFDSNDREPLRADAKARFDEIDQDKAGFRCICCER